MAKVIEVTVKNIDARIKSWSGRGATITAEVQDATKCAIAYYHGSDDKNALYITKVMNGVLATKGLNANKYKAYILAVCPNLKYQKNKAGDPIFTTDKAKKGDPAIVDEVTLGTLWADFKPNGAGAQQSFDLDKSMATLVKKADGVTRSELITALDKALAAQAQKDAKAPTEAVNIPVPPADFVGPVQPAMH